MAQSKKPSSAFMKAKSSSDTSARKKPFYSKSPRSHGDKPKPSRRKKAY